MQTTAVVRDRYQITIPDKVRTLAEWAQPSSVVTISSTGDEIIIRPYDKKKVDWDKIVKAIRKLRSYRDIQGSMSEFIAEDRYRH